MTYSFFKHPDLDATIGLAIDGDRIAVVLLSEGCSRSGKPGAYVYKRRNPDRRKLANLLLPPDGLLSSVLKVHTVRAGKTAQEPVACDNAGALKAFRSGGNYRVDMWATSAQPWVDAVEVYVIAEHLGLVVAKNRPVAVRWECAR